MHFRGTNNIAFSIIKALFLTSLYNYHFCLPVFFFFFGLCFVLFFVLFVFFFSNLAITRHFAAQSIPVMFLETY